MSDVDDTPPDSTITTRAIPGTLFQVENPSVPQIVQHRSPDIHMYNLSREQIESLNLDTFAASLATACLGLTVTFLIAATTVTLSDRAFAAFLALSFAAGGLTLIFGYSTLKSWLRSRREKRKLFGDD